MVSRDKERLNETIFKISEKRAAISAMPADLHQKEEVERFGAGSAEPFGAPDILINTVVINLRENP